MQSTAERLDFDDSPMETISITRIKDVRKEHEDFLKYVSDNTEEAFNKSLKVVLRKQLEMGIPISYGDGAGNVLRRYPNGKVFLAHLDKETFKKTETFLRMATDEENARIYG